MVSLLGFTGGLTGFFYRFLAYTFLRWIPGRHGTYLLPAFFVLNALTFYFNRTSRIPIQPRPVATPAQAALVPETPNAPSFAQIAATEPATDGNQVVQAHVHHDKDSSSDSTNELVQRSASPTPSSTSSTNGSVRRRKKRNGNSSRLANELDDLVDTVEAQDVPKSNVSLRSLLSTLILSAPSKSIFLNRTTMLLNVVLLAATLDALWTPILGMHEHDLAFARVGAVDHSSAKIFARVPPAHVDLVGVEHSTNESLLANALIDRAETFSGARVVYRPTKPIGKWVEGGELRVDESHDYTGVLTLKGLWAQTEYEFRLLRPTLASSHHPYFPETYTFTTFPDPALSSAGSPGSGNHFTFASTSCVKPGFPYTGPWGKKSIKGARLLKKTAEEKGLKFLIMLGDFIYADVPYYAGATKEQYQRRYRQTFASPDMLSLVEKLPSVFIYDDHEIRNDFSSGAKDPAFTSGNSAYLDYLGSANPDPIDPNTNYYSFRHGDAAFFVWDTRAYRSENSAVDDETKTMLGQKQRDTFDQWLREVNQTVTWKFIVSSVPLMSLWSHGDDTWAGFLNERDAIMDTLQYVPNVIVLSGDRHEFAAASIRTTVTEFSTSPLNMFYLPIRTLSQSNNRGQTGEDVLLNYLPDGNHKFTTFEVDTRVVNQPVVRVEAHVDGEVAWQVEVRGKPVRSPSVPRAIGSLGKSLLELLGFKKRKWF